MQLFTLRNRHKDRRARRATLVLSLILLALFASTTVYTVTNQLYCKQIILLSFGSPSTEISQLEMSNCTTTAALTINVCVFLSHLRNTRTNVRVPLLAQHCR